MNSNLKLLPAALFVAVLALAGCGGGSSDDMTPDPAPTPTPTPTPPPSGNEQVDQSGKAVEAALAARTAALKAEADGETAAKGLTTRAVRGNSAMAAMNAQAIIDAAAEVEKQIMAAENAVAMIEAAIAALPADTVNRAGVLASLNDDLMSAKGYLTDINDDVNLEGELYMVKGQLDEGMPSDFSTKVAAAIQSAFDAEDSPGTAWWLDVVADDNRVGHTNAAGADADARAARLKYGVSASTAPPSFMPLTLTGGALNLSGALLSQFTDRGDGAEEDGVLVAAELTTGTTPINANPRAVTYKGLMGNLTCATATECGSKDGALTGPWSLAMDPASRTTDSDPNALYRLVEGKYVAFEGGYVTYGYWLGGTDDAPNINTFAVPSGYGDFVAATVTVGSTAGPLTASYNGDASGIAVIRTVNPNDATDVTSRRSGAFTADVSLSADFSGTAPELSGDITGFAGGVADPTWRVELRPANVDTSTGALTADPIPAAVGFRGTSEAETEGRWTAQMAGGAAGARPTAVYGGFGAYFPNGEAVGAYQAD